MKNEFSAIERLTSIKSKVSSHYLINEKGNVFRLVKDENIAWHAGKSCWKGFNNLNKNSIGIELVNKGHEFGYSNFKKKQILNLIKICRELIKKYKIKKSNIVGHSDIAPLRKIDPGEKFPWKYLSKKKVGIWHNKNLNYLKKFRKKSIYLKKDKKEFINILSKIGYGTLGNKKLWLKKTTKAFQRHFRKELINGNLDQECLIIAKNLKKKL